MPKWIIYFNVGYGDNFEIREAETEEAARMEAYEAAREEFENNAEYSAEPYTKERAIDLEIEEDDEAA